MPAPWTRSYRALLRDARYLAQTPIARAVLHGAFMLLDHRTHDAEAPPGIDARTWLAVELRIEMELLVPALEALDQVGLLQVGERRISSPWLVSTAKPLGRDRTAAERSRRYRSKVRGKPRDATVTGRDGGRDATVTERDATVSGAPGSVRSSLKSSVDSEILSLPTLPREDPERERDDALPDRDGTVTPTVTGTVTETEALAHGREVLETLKLAGPKLHLLAEPALQGRLGRLALELEAGGVPQSWPLTFAAWAKHGGLSWHDRAGRPGVAYLLGPGVLARHIDEALEWSQSRSAESFRPAAATRSSSRPSVPPQSVGTSLAQAEALLKGLRGRSAKH